MNLCALVLSGAYLASLYYRVSINPIRLPRAAALGQRKTVERLLAKGIDINTQLGGSTALSNAVARGDEEMVELLLAHGADVDIGSPLSEAARRGDEEMLELLLAHGADVRIGSPVSAAASRGHVDIVKSLLEKGANPNCLRSVLSSRNGEIVELLLKHGADVNHRDGNKRTPLHRGVVIGTEENLRILRILIDKGADVNAKDHRGETPLHVIVRTWPQRQWVKDFRKKTIYMLLDGGADIEARTVKGKTPLHLAAEAPGCRDAIKLLLERGADAANIVDVHARFTAAPLTMDRTELKKWVRANATNVNAKNARGESLLHAAVKGGNETLVEILLELGANIHSETAAGDTALHWAVKDHQVRMVNLLVTQGADVNAQNSKGMTPLHVAAEPLSIGSEKPLDAQTRRVFEILLANGARTDIPDNRGATPLDRQKRWAPRSRGGRQYREEVLKLMRKHEQE